MKIEHVFGISFSPCGATQTVVNTVAKAMDENAVCTNAITNIVPAAFTAQDAVVVGIPVFGGRVPAPALERISHLQGGGAAAVAVAVYGKRACEDALLELKTALEAQGFAVVAAGVFVAQHSIATSIAAGRPNAQDLQTAAQLGRQTVDKLSAVQSGAQCTLATVPGNYPYGEYHIIPVPILASRRCNACGVCAAACPVQAISANTPRRTDGTRCIGCMHCLSVCPQHARSIPPLMKLAITHKLNKLCKGEKQAELYL